MPSRGTVLGWLAWTLGLAAVTLLIFGELRRFNLEPVDRPLDRGFVALAEGIGSAWSIEGDPGRVTLRDGVLHLAADASGAPLSLRQGWTLDADAPHAFQLAATVAAAGLEQGRGEISLVVDGDIGRHDLGPIHQLVRLRGEHGPARYVARFAFPHDARRVELAIRVTATRGELTVKGLEMQALRERWVVRAGRNGLIGAWAVTLALGGWWLARGVDDRRSALVLAAAASGGLLLLLLPQEGRNDLLAPLTGLVPGRALSEEQVGDLGHLVIFAAIGLLVRLSRRRDPAWLQLLLLVGCAGLSELLQYLAELRTPTLGDWLTDALGAVVGWLPAALWLRWRARAGRAGAQLGQPETQR